MAFGGNTLPSSALYVCVCVCECFQSVFKCAMVFLHIVNFKGELNRLVLSDRCCETESKTEKSASTVAPQSIEIE